MELYNKSFNGSGGTEGLTVENGFEDKSKSLLTLDGLTVTIESIAPDTCYYWSNGKRYGITSPMSVAFDQFYYNGPQFFYLDGPELKLATSFSEDLITKYALVAVGYYSIGDNAPIIFGDERHGRIMDSTTHLYHHSTEGAKWGRGLKPVQITHGNGNNAIDAQIGIEAGTIWDEDLRIDIAAVSRPLYAPFLYRSGDEGWWRKAANSNGYVAIRDAGTRAAYNQWTGTTWQLTELTTNDYACMHLLATNDIYEPLMWVVGQNRYTTLTLAREGADIEWQNLNTGQLETLMPEFSFIATFVIQTASGYSNAVKSKIVTQDNGTSFVDLRKR